MANHRKPRRTKVLHGTFRRDRDRPEPEFPPVEGAIDPPDWVISADAKAIWHELVELLTASRVLTTGHLTALGHLCNKHGVCAKAWRESREPTAAQQTELRLSLASFGLDPASSTKARPASSGKAKNPFEALA